MKTINNLIVCVIFGLALSVSASEATRTEVNDVMGKVFIAKYDADYEAMASYSRELITLLKQQKNPSEFSLRTAYESLGEAAYELKRYDESLESYSLALDILNSLGIKDMYEYRRKATTIRIGLRKIYDIQYREVSRKFEDAMYEEKYDAALSIATNAVNRLHPDHFDYYRYDDFQRLVRQVYSKRNDHQAVEENFKQVVARFESVQPRHFEFLDQTLRSMSNFYVERKQYKKAEKCLLQALKSIVNANPSPGYHIGILETLAFYYFDRKNFSKADDFFNKVIQMLEDEEYSAESFAERFERLAVFYLNTEDYVKAEEYFFKTIEVLQSSDDYQPVSIVPSLEWLVWIYLELDDFKKAERYKLESDEAWKTQDPQGFRRALQAQRMAEFYRDYKLFDKAKKYYDEVEANLREPSGIIEKHNYWVYYDYLESLLQFYKMQSQLAEEYSVLEKLLNQPDLSDKEKINFYTRMSEIDLTMGRHDTAEKYLKMAQALNKALLKKFEYAPDKYQTPEALFKIETELSKALKQH